MPFGLLPLWGLLPRDRKSLGFVLFWGFSPFFFSLPFTGSCWEMQMYWHLPQLITPLWILLLKHMLFYGLVEDLIIFISTLCFYTLHVPGNVMKWNILYIYLSVKRSKHAQFKWIHHRFPVISPPFIKTFSILIALSPFGNQDLPSVPLVGFLVVSNSTNMCRRWKPLFRGVMGIKTHIEGEVQKKRVIGPILVTTWRGRGFRGDTPMRHKQGTELYHWGKQQHTLMFNKACTLLKDKRICYPPD